MLTRCRHLLARLVLLDRELCGGAGLSVRRFARRHEVSARTVYRDLDLIRHRLGQRLEFDAASRRWRYAAGSGPLFSEAVRARAL